MHMRQCIDGDANDLSLRVVSTEYIQESATSLNEQGTLNSEKCRSWIRTHIV